MRPAPQQSAGPVIAANEAKQWVATLLDPVEAWVVRLTPEMTGLAMISALPPVVIAPRTLRELHGER
jgi:hypothetical protein